MNNLGRQISFLCGDAGSLAIAAVIYNDMNDARMMKTCIDK
jgi:hypothetical protein